MNGHIVKWVTSQRGQPQLVVDDYKYTNNGKGKNANIMYWLCAGSKTFGCSVRAVTDRQALSDLRGQHQHPNDIVEVGNIEMKVSCLNCRQKAIQKGVEKRVITLLYLFVDHVEKKSRRSA
jgi:hypothetical protein